MVHKCSFQHFAVVKLLFSSFILHACLLFSCLLQIFLISCCPLPPSLSQSVAYFLMRLLSVCSGLQGFQLAPGRSALLAAPGAIHRGEGNRSPGHRNYLQSPPTSLNSSSNPSLLPSVVPSRLHNPSSFLSLSQSFLQVSKCRLNNLLSFNIMVSFHQ